MVMRGIVLMAAAMLGGWMTFDGLRAVLTGNYFTPSSGEYAGQLGPWASLVRGVGLDPLSGFMKALFVLLGIGWLSATVGFATGAAWARPALIALAVASLWYLPVGTLFAAAILVILFILRSRGV